ncbi:lipocalin family protein [Hymenobacter nivis]|uniref:Lipocalin-like domain-containing protein n=1 Tax=Hymenobacter nivis TaxID=1850093 RepID=A0A502H1S5_9BACT|nr:lipocalin family protein [Hymenobacter nivis]TPG67316.1 hypothetical protein EAH73_06225 [Hymenobacter nivis]
MKKALLLLLVAASLGACKKNDDTAPRSNTDLLTARNWRLSAGTTTIAINNGPPKTTDDYASAVACERDDFLKFNADQSLVSDGGPLLCNPSNPRTQTGSWNFENNETKLTITDPSIPGPGQTFDVVALSASTLRLHATVSYGSSGTTATATIDETLTAF